jgi:hypothetical protein
MSSVVKRYFRMFSTTKNTEILFFPENRYMLFILQSL